MLKLITGHSGTGKTSRVIDEIKRDIATGHRVFLVVPEQQTVSVERSMATILPPDAPLHFEVVNFTRLADTVFRLHGGLAKSGCSGAAEQLTMWRILMTDAPFLHTPIKAEPKNVDKMRRIVKELRAMRLDYTDLREAAEKCEGELREKLEDYARISEHYHKVLNDKEGDTSDHLDRLADMLEKYPFSDKTTFYFDNFSSFTAQEYGVIESLIRHTDITITLCVPQHKELQLSAAEVDSTLASLRKIAARCSTEIKEERQTESYRLTNPIRSHIAAHLFRSDYATLPPYDGETKGGDPAFRLVECADPLDACDYIAADIRRRVMHGECRYMDFAVVCGSAANYTGLIDASFEKYDIPFFFSHGQTLLALEPVKMLLLAYDIISEDWKREDVIAYLKSVPANIPDDVRDELELYSETWNIHGARWYDGITWNMNPYGYNTPDDSDDDDEVKRKKQEEREANIAGRLARVNEARDILVTPLSALAAMSDSRHTVTAHISALTEFLLALSLPDYLRGREEKLMHSDRATATEYGRLWDVLCDALDTMNHVIGDITLSTEEFAAQLRMLFSAEKIGAIPANLDEVTVAEARMIRAGEIPHVYLLGANEGEFPPPPSPDIAFTEAEWVTLSAKGALSLEESDARTARELYAFWRALNMAKDSATVIWNRAGISLDAALPSDPVKRILHLLGENYPVERPTQTDLFRMASTPAAAREGLGRIFHTPEGMALRRVLGEDSLYADDVLALPEPICNENRTISSSLASQLWKGDLAMTQSRIQKFMDCPFSYFCTYVLKLESEETATFDTSTVGNFIHKVLEYFFSLVKERNLKLGALTAEEQAQLLAEVKDEIIRKTLPPEERNIPRNRVLLQSLAESAAATIASLCEEFSHSRFEPAFFELKIDNKDDKTPDPVTFALSGKEKIYIYGKIDRVDIYREDNRVYIRVVDYKTGVKKFKLDDIEQGINLQLLLYLFAITESKSAAFSESLGISDKGKILPAAVLYLSSLTGEYKSSKPTGEDESRTLAMKVAERSGLIIDDRGLIDAMDDTPDKTYLPIRITVNNTYDSRCLGNITTDDALKDLKEKIGKILSALGSSIKSGDASAKPMQQGGKNTSACEWCNFKAICRYTAPDRRKKRDGGKIKTTPDAD